MSKIGGEENSGSTNPPVPSAGDPASELLKTSRTIAVVVGQELGLTLGTVGPGQYASPPTVSATALVFLVDSMVGPALPSGPTQRFWFRAALPGRAVITFHHTAQVYDLQDTVEVH